MLVISNSSTSRELYCAGDRGILEDCIREACIWGVLKTHYPNLRVTTFQDVSVSWTLINSFTNLNSMTYCVSKTSFRGFFNITSHCRYKQLVKNKLIYHHRFLAVMSYSHPGFMHRKLRHGDIKRHQGSCKPYRKNNSEHLNHEVFMILLEEQHQSRDVLRIKETAAGTVLCPTSNGSKTLLSHLLLPDLQYQVKGKLVQRQRLANHQIYWACRSL